MTKSISEQVEDWAKRQLDNIKYYSKTETINSEIEEALKKAPTKRGGSGTNFPDIKLFIEAKSMRKIPVMIEVKGLKGSFIKLNKNNEIQNRNQDGTTNYYNINKYAVNGAIHYANAIIDYTDSYNETLAIGLNGYDEPTGRIYEIGAYYISSENFCIPKKLGDFSDLSFLLPKNHNYFFEKINNINLTDEEIENKTKEYENEIELKLKALNQVMQDDLEISVGSRVGLVTGMIMAALGVEKKVAPLKVSELKGELGKTTHDGYTIINKIDSFLAEKNLPEEKKEMIINDLKRIFIYSDLWKPMNGESKLKTVYSSVKNDIMPIFTSAKHLDFTGRLFNILNEWVDIPDSDKNDVVLTPRYITDLMAKLVQVNRNSYVWDYAVGTAGFLISSMKLMIKDAQENIKSPNELNIQLEKIKKQQILGIEKRSDIYLLAVLNMILMGDGSSNIIHKNSLTQYKGTYEQGELSGHTYPANVFLLNPPYSAKGKGFVFVEKALAHMKSGKAAILIQENAGSGNGLPYTKRILKNNTLLASIHMPDIFKGKAGVQTAIYLFDIGNPHDQKKLVKFIDFSNDGYTRQNRKRATQKTNLKNSDHAPERYEELINLVLYGKTYLHYFKEKEYIEDTISMNGDDWTYVQHIKFDTTPVETDYRNVVKDYLGWKESILSENTSNTIINNYNGQFSNLTLNEYNLTKNEETAIKKFRNKTIDLHEFFAEEFFEVKNNPQLNKDSFKFTTKRDNTFPYFTRTKSNNGIAGYVDYLDDEHKIAGNTIAVGMLGMRFFYMEQDYYAGQFTKSIVPKFDEFNNIIAKYFLAWFNKNSPTYQGVLVRDFEKIFNNTKLILPVNVQKDVDYLFIENFISAQEKMIVKDIEVFYSKRIQALKKMIQTKC